MKSLPLDSTRGRQRPAWHHITALGQHTVSNVGCGMSSPPLDSTHGRTTSGVACHHRPWTAHTVGRRPAWYDIKALGLHARSDDVKRGMTSPPLDNTHGRTTSGVACHHHLWVAQTVERHRAWHAIIELGRHTRSNNVGRDMQSPYRTAHDRTKSGMA